MLEGGEHALQHCRDVLRYEEEADGITREVLIGIRTTFITPFDRGDIKDLITSMDDAIDEMQKTAKAIVLFELTTFEPDMRAMADAIVDAPRPDEIVLWIGYGLGPRVNARCKGPDQKEVDALIASFDKT
jgi:uncharacterized protein Yka (UPF0111/DUF47 family)